MATECKNNGIKKFKLNIPNYITMIIIYYKFEKKMYKNSSLFLILEHYIRLPNL